MPSNLVYFNTKNLKLHEKNVIRYFFNFLQKKIVMNAQRKHFNFVKTKGGLSNMLVKIWGWQNLDKMVKSCKEHISLRLYIFTYERIGQLINSL